MSTEPRRSSRANKGTHTGRDLLDVYYRFEDEPDAKRRKPDGDFEPESHVTESSTLNANPLSKLTGALPISRALEGDVRCDPCGTTQGNYDEENDEGGMMIECDDCGTWQHAQCMGYKTKRAIPKQYACNRCDVTKKRGENAGNGAAEAASAAPSETQQPHTEKPHTDTAVATKLPANKTRQSVIKAIANVLLKHPEVDGQKAQHWAFQMESAIHAWSGTTDKKYIDKSRSVMALVKKANVFQRVVEGGVTANDLVVLPPEEIDDELKDYAEKVRQELIRRSVLTVEDELSRRIRRTHKGEEVVETASNDDEINVSMAARRVDHRVFREVTPTRENVIGTLTGPNLYQIADDDEEDDTEKKTEPEPEKEGGDSANDSDEELDFILGSKSPEKAPQVVKPEAKPASPKPPPTMPNRFWSGDIVFPDFVQFGARASFVGCTNYEKPKDVTTASFHNRAIRVSKELLEKPRYSIEGRLDRKRADPYVEKITSSRDLYVVQLEATDGEKDYDKLFDYLYSKSKVGVLSGKAACVKDAYLYAFDEDAPGFLNLGPISRGLYGVFVVKKDYVPVGKSILKKSLPPQQRPSPPQQRPTPPQNTSSSLDSILSKLAGAPAPEIHQPVPNAPVYAQQLPLELTADQLQYLSQLVNQNPHVQQNPQALLSLLQNNQMPGYH